MRKSKRLIAFALFLCLTISLMNPALFAKAAVRYRYELDTNGVDVGATYLIVNANTAGAGNALKFNYTSSSNRDLRNQALTIKSENGIPYIEAGFTSEADCQFQFTSTYRGNLTHGDYYLDLANSQFESGYGTNLYFNHIGNGQYRIYATSGYKTYYLHYSNSDWVGMSGSFSVYLYKLVEYEVSYDVTFDGNGYTAGTLPANATDVSSDVLYTIPEPVAPLRKDIGDDTWLFLCWNTKADGTGIEYHPGDQITLTGDLTLYADWYQQTKYTVSMITYMDGVATDVDKFAGYDRQFFAKLEGGDGTYITLNRQAEGTYSAKVPENGTYTIYAITAEGAYEQVHGHNVVIYNQDGTTECMHYSVSYDTDGGIWANGEAPTAEKYHFGEAVTAYDKVPTKEGYTFRGWRDQNGKTYEPSQLITEQITEKLTLTAIWEDTITVTVNVVIDHNAKTTGFDNDPSMHDIIFSLVREENGANLLIEEKVLTSGYTYDADRNVTTYQVVFQNMPKGEYHVASTKSYYETSYSHEEDENGQVLNINLQYAPENFDLTFDVVINADNEAEKALMPKAVNVKVTYWGYNEQDELGWHIITQQEGTHAPTTVQIDENGKGTGYFPVWHYWSGTTQPYLYRVAVTSFIMPDGSIVPASGGHEVYTVNGSGLYTATVAVDDGELPTYPAGSTTDLKGAYYVGRRQVGLPTVTVEINPMTVTLNAGDGKVNGQDSIVLENQYRHPDLHQYVAVPNEADKVFIGWADEKGNLVTDVRDLLLAGNVTYTAVYSQNITISGTVKTDATYTQDGQKVQIIESDLVKTVLVVLQKKVGDVYNDIDSVAVTITYEKNSDGKYTVGLGNYEFKDLPNDGTEYRVHVLVRNYNDAYNNNQDNAYSAGEAIVKIDNATLRGQVDIYLNFVPDSYGQLLFVDASQIHHDLRPTGALAQILYRDLGNAYHYQTISQHTVDPFGIKVELDPATATGYGLDEIWNWHTDGAPYEYQLQISTLYGNNVPGAYNKDGTAYTADSPFTIVYGRPNNFLQQQTEGGVALTATLVPKEYMVKLDLNLGDDSDTPIYGLEDYMVDDGTGNNVYAFLHTWSFAEEFTAYPYREGYVFNGWVSPNTDDVFIQDGIVHVGDTLASDITLTASWTKLEGTDYTIRYLELNTDKVLKSATAVSGVAEGYRVVAADAAVDIKGYTYAGAWVDGKYMPKTDNPAMAVTSNPKQNLLIIYYLPDGSDGYTDQVESNLEINKTAVLQNDGTYTITMDTFTKDNPITTLIQNDTPLDIVLVLDQSASIYSGGYLDELQTSVENFIELVATHAEANEVDHRIAMVGYANNEYSSYFTESDHPIANSGENSWINTGVFDSNGDFHSYPVTGFNYTPYNGVPDRNGTYYTFSHDEYLLLTYYDEYYHLLTAEEARVEVLSGTTVYGEIENGILVTLTRNSSGLWLYGDRQLYSGDKFYTFHENVWTHRQGTGRREIHAHVIDGVYTPADNHQGLYTRTETRDANPQLNVYKDALVPVTVGAGGTGATNPCLIDATTRIGSNGQTYVQYGLEMANRVFEANPLEGENADRLRIVVVFTDGMPGDGNFMENVANEAIELAYATKNSYGAQVYTVGLYTGGDASVIQNQHYFMNAMSSKYPEAHKLTDVLAQDQYVPAPDCAAITKSTLYYALVDNEYKLLTSAIRHDKALSTYVTTWGYTDELYDARIEISVNVGLNVHPGIVDGMIGGYEIFNRVEGGLADSPYGEYYSTIDNEGKLEEYFTNVLRDITTNITTEVILESDTILRDIMNQGFVMTDDTIISVYTQKGVYNLTTNSIDWSVDEDGNPILIPMVELALSSGKTSAKSETSGVTINTYNLDATNPTLPDQDNYHPHTVDITGYDFHNWYISADNDEGFKMVVTITRIEATDDVQWGRSTATNHEQSGLWLPKDDNGNRQLLLPFDQPTTIFVERAYVLDYGKEFTLSGWYFDDENGKNATPIHVDCDIENGMNGFDTPNKSNSIDGQYGNTKYGNVNVNDDGTVTYSPTTMNWGSHDSFYVFGDTWRQTVLAQDANENGNLWNKVTVIPANNIYYEDSFTIDNSTGTEGQNKIEGFVFDSNWSIEGDNSGNTESPETREPGSNGGVHGWTEALADDLTFTDGSAHVTGLDGKAGAKAEFTFTGTGVEVYTRTNADSGMVVAILSRVTVGNDGKESTSIVRMLSMDNLAMSGDYYHIPTVSFKDLSYGTYKLQLIATAAGTNENARYVYYIDGVRILNPLGNTTNYQSDVIKDAYGLENNAVYTEVRDILLDYGDFNPGLSDGTDDKMGAVFIDWLKPGQGSGSDEPGTSVPTYNIGTFEEYGPKNEVYLASGQAIVLKVDERNTYYVGLKSLNGQEVTVNVSGVDDLNEPKSFTLSHTTDLYYRVTPVNGYIVIQNGSVDVDIDGDGEVDPTLLSITNLRTTNLTAPVTNGGIQRVSSQEALEVISTFAAHMAAQPENPQPEPSEPDIPSAEEWAENNRQQADKLFGFVRKWLES